MHLVGFKLYVYTYGNVGPLKLLEIAMQCKNIEVFAQISTAYVNSDKTGFI